MIRFLQKSGQTTKYVLGGLLLLICASMVITLIPGGIGGDVFTGTPGRGVVAKVDGGDISAEEVRVTARQMAQQDAQRYGEMAAKIMPFLIEQETTRAVDQLINRQALLSEASRMGFRVTPEEVKDELQHGRYAATFFPGGNFIGETEYEDMLQRGANLTPAKFEEEVGHDILITKLQAFISGSASVSESEIHAEFLKENSKVKFDYAILKQDDLRKGLHPTDEELKAFYESHKRSYANSVPEKRKVKYVLVETSKAEASVQVTPDDLRAYYDQHREQYRVPEQVKVSHIWIKMPLPGADGKIDDKAVAEAQHRAEDLLKQLKGGAKFEDVAKKYSEDPGSSNVGGSLGWIGKGQMTAEFEKAAFALPKGQVSDVVKSLDGFHIIRVDDKQEAHVKPLDEVKSQIEPILKHQKGQQAAQQKADALLKDARAQGLDAAAAAQGVPVISSDFFSRKDMLPGLGPASQFMDAVFSAAEKAPPDEAAASQGMVVFQLLAVKPAATPTFEEIRSRVEEEFKSERSSTLLSQKIQELSDRAKAEHDLKRAAKELGATLKTSDFVLPDGQVPDVGSMAGQASVAFNMKPGEISGPINNGSNAVVLAVIENQQPTDGDYAAKRDQIKDQMLLQKQQERFGLFVAGLIDEMTKSGKIKKNAEEIKALTKNGSEQGM
ncbi:MAG TPA: peptidyl-prolyl cis-trans isomerase [Candidatus Sulfotelmatobacter sp.]|nr:peptidyl-prolyl cis-trans isomerase [Candidatus Sulfotelmatobacter sp.]